MPTLRQLSFYGRKNKRRRCAVAALVGSPQRLGVVVKVATTTPRKPNSAKRKYAKVRVMFSKKVIFAHIPGIGNHGLQEYSIVLVEGGSPPDVPGVNYSLVRGQKDFYELESFKRRKRRSKFGTKRPLFDEKGND